MDEERFIEYMQKAKKQDSTINDYVKSIRICEDYLRSKHQINGLDESTPKDLTAFIQGACERGENAYRYLWGIRMYYEFKQLLEMEKTAREWMEYLQNETRKLGEFPKVDKSSVKRLSAVGVTTVNQFLTAGSTPEEREALSQRSGAPLEAIEELYKLSELSRLPGLKKVRARLFYEAGLDTLASIAALEPEEVQSRLQDYVERTGYNGIAPVLGEAQVAVSMARFLLNKK